MFFKTRMVKYLNVVSTKYQYSTVQYHWIIEPSWHSILAQCELRILAARRYAVKKEKEDNINGRVFVHKGAWHKEPNAESIGLPDGQRVL